MYSEAERLTAEELAALKKEARVVLTELTEEYAGAYGFKYSRISIRAQKSRWGSCSRDGNLNYNCLLMLAPESVQRYVVVHELCHLREMNHSRRFWELVEINCPNWRKERRWLKENGEALIMRLPEKE